MQPDLKYTIYKTRRKTMLLKLKNDGSVAIYCPKSCSKKIAIDFFEKNRNKLISLAESRRKKRLITVFGDDPSGSPSLLYFGERYPVLYGSVKKLTFDGKSFIAPKNTDLDTLFVLYKDLLRAETKGLLSAMTFDLAKSYGFSYDRVFIKDMSSRFGSCSAKGNVNFSLCLSAFCRDFIRFIVLHELCHTVHMNHSADFHRLLERVCPDCKALDKAFRPKYSEILRAVCS